MSNLIRTAIIQNGIVVNIIEYETAPTGVPDGFDESYSAIATDIGQIGWGYSNGGFTDLNPPKIIIQPIISLPTAAELLVQLQAIQAQLLVLQEN
jgi:hypothetical protein